MAGGLEFRLFGEVEAFAAGQPLDVGTPRQQTVLAALLVDAGRPVAAETLIDRVWGDMPPVEARNVLYSHLSRIRRMLGRAAALTGAVTRIERRHAGYVLSVDPDLVDLHRFARLVDRGSDARSADADRAKVLAQALDLWRGTPLAALSGEWVTQVRDSWHRRRLNAAVQWAGAELRLGHANPVVARLPDLVNEHPLVEPLEALLMRALHATGCGAQALDRYAAIRQRLADELGTDPSAELQDLHRAILRGEFRPPPSQSLQTSQSGRATEPARRLALPAQLPPDLPAFTGRGRELRRLDDLLPLAADPAPTGRSGDAAVIVIIDGTAGVGKTALAVHWAHRIAGRFPDGQLHVDLHGFGPTGLPVSPAEAVRRFLDAFEVPAERIPSNLEAQVGLYRSLLANRRVLVVLDNARDAEQVRPLLPAGRGCVAVVTSRNRLSGLVAAIGAHPLTLGLPTPAEARELLAGRVGTDAVAAEPVAINEIIALCARLPLALAVTAARAASHPGFGFAVLADELRAARGRLDELADADPVTDARTVFSWSYRQLDPAAARLFRLLGLHPGPDVAVPAAASLAGLPVAVVRPLLAELSRAHLFTEHLPGRYACHDLLRAYAAELAQRLDTDAERRAALGRALGHYLYSAEPADELLNPHRDDPPELPALPPGAEPVHLAGRAQALAWFQAEYPVLLTVIRGTTGFDEHICQLAWMLNRFFGYRGHWHDSITVLDTALNTAGRLGSTRQMALAHRALGCTYVRLNRGNEAHTHLYDALDLYRTAGDLVGEAHTHRMCCWLLERQGRPAEALGHAERALDLFQAAGFRSGQARARNAVGWFHAALGRYREAIDHCEQALALQCELGDRFGQAETLDSLGYAHGRLGCHARAVGCYRTAAALYHEFDDRYNEADTMVSLGDVHHAAGDVGSAREVWERALDVFTLIGHPDADEVRARLDRLADRDGGSASRSTRVTR